MSSSAAAGDSDVNYGPRVIYILSPMIAVVTVVIVLRTMVVLRRHGHLSVDDWLAIGAFIFSWALYGTTMAFVVRGGLGQPSANADGDANHIRYMARIEFACEMLYAFTIVLARTSILTTHWRLFPTKVGRWAYLFLGVLTVGWGVTLVIINVIKCHPVSKVFDPSIPGNCINGEQFFSGFGIPNIVTDGAILFIAIYQVMHLHLPRFKRASLIAVFLIGAATISAACVRMMWFCILSKADAKGTNDVLIAKAEAQSYLWSVLEVDLCLICASIPAWGPVVSHIGDRIWSILSFKTNSTNKSTSKGKGSATGGRGSSFGFKKYYANHSNSSNTQPLHYQQQQQGGGYYYNVSGQQQDGFYHDQLGSNIHHHQHNISSSKQPSQFETLQPVHYDGDGNNGIAMGAVYSPSAASQSYAHLQQAHNQFCYPQQHQQSGSGVQGTPDLFVHGYGGEHHASVRKTSSILSDEVPYGSIAVKTVVEQV